MDKERLRTLIEKNVVATIGVVHWIICDPDTNEERGLRWNDGKAQIIQFDDETGEEATVFFRVRVEIVE
jgi:hypothetical protein